MKVFSFDEFIASKPLRKRNLSITVGVFDGMHLGHQAVVRRAVGEALGCKGESLVITFNINPKPGRPEKRLSTLEENNRIFESMGVDYSAVIDFSPAIAKLSGEAFLSAVNNSCVCRAMVVSSDFKCGNPGSQLGSAELGRYLRADARAVIVPEVTGPDGKIISSTQIRELLQKGLVEDVCTRLGRSYGLELGDASFRLNNALLYTSCSLKNLLPCSGIYSADVVGIGNRMIRVNSAGDLEIPPDCAGARRIRLIKEL